MKHSHRELQTRPRAKVPRNNGSPVWTATRTQAEAGHWPGAGRVVGSLSAQRRRVRYELRAPGQRGGEAPPTRVLDVQRFHQRGPRAVDFLDPKCSKRETKQLEFHADWLEVFHVSHSF